MSGDLLVPDQARATLPTPAAIASMDTPDELVFVIRCTESLEFAAKKLIVEPLAEVQRAQHIRLLAMRRAGELIPRWHEEGKLHKPGRPKTAPTGNGKPARTAEVFGSRKNAARCLAFARIPAALFEASIAEAHARGINGERAIKKLAEKLRKADADNAAIERFAAPSDSRVFASISEVTATGERYAGLIVAPTWSTTSAATPCGPAMLSPADLAALPIAELAMEENALVGLWATPKFLFEATRIVEKWEFEGRGCFIWAKRDGDIEILVIGARGAASAWRPERSWICSPTRPSLHGSIEEALPGPFLELFAEALHPGWAAVLDALSPSRGLVGSSTSAESNIAAESSNHNTGNNEPVPVGRELQEGAA